MVKGTFEEKQANREKYAAVRGGYNLYSRDTSWPTICKVLNECGDDVLAKGQDTVAVGFLETDQGCLMIVSPKVGTNLKSTPINDNFVAAMADAFAKDLKITLKTLKAREIPDGLHAEMGVVREIIEQFAPGIRPEFFGQVIADQAKEAVARMAGRLWIACLGKPVCMDCGGWMTAHNIKHMSIVKTNDTYAPEYRCGGRTQTWINPRTGSKFGKGGFGHQADPSFYKKSFLDRL